jgi:hypothetical protein
VAWPEIGMEMLPVEADLNSERTGQPVRWSDKLALSKVHVFSDK